MKEINGVAIGEKIKEHRKRLGLSQTQFGEAIGKNLRTVQKYEKGEIDLSFANLNEIARVLGVPSTELLGYDATKAQINSFADVLGFFFALEKVEGINFSIDVKRPPHHDGWECSLNFNGKDRDAAYNQDICLFLEEWQGYRAELAERLAKAREIGGLQEAEVAEQIDGKSKDSDESAMNNGMLEALKSPQLSFQERLENSAKATYSDWQDKTLAYYSGEM